MKELACAAMVGFFCLAGVLVCNMFERHDMQKQIERLKATQSQPLSTSPRSDGEGE